MEEQRLLAVLDHDEGASIAELAEIHGVSRKTIYKWLERHEQQGLAGLKDLSRRPHHSPNQVSAEVEAAIIEARRRWKWGPRKLLVKLCQQDHERRWPSVSTIAAVLKNKGLVVNRRTRPRTPIQSPPYVAAVFADCAFCAIRIERSAVRRWPGARSRLSPACWPGYRTYRIESVTNLNSYALACICQRWRRSAIQRYRSRRDRTKRLFANWAVRRRGRTARYSCSPRQYRRRPLAGL